ncbi:MAG TPA: helix-turn-helix transcriptional regulator [Yinghuangia sp.]|nr:helix-turn-helix transcriptional regulator [Yinghuangia sp.]
MGRPEAPLQAGPTGALAQQLRDLRSQAGLTYKDMADRTKLCSAATLARAADGRHVPTRAVLEEYVRICGGDEAPTLRLWKRARRRAAEQQARTRQGPAPRRRRRLDGVSSPDDLAAMMHAVRVASGNPSLRVLQARAKKSGAHPLAPSTVSDVLSGKRPPSWKLLEAYLRACEVPPTLDHRWWSAWVRACGGPMADAAIEMFGRLDADERRAYGIPRNLTLGRFPAPPVGAPARQPMTSWQQPKVALIPGPRAPAGMKGNGPGRPPATERAQPQTAAPRGPAHKDAPGPGRHGGDQDPVQRLRIDGLPPPPSAAGSLIRARANEVDVSRSHDNAYTP